MNKKIYLLAFGIALSIVLHMYLTPKFYQMNYGGGTGEPSICNINSTLNCDEVAASRYASFLNIPMSIWGFALNFVLFMLLLGYMLADDRKSSWLAGLKILTVLSALGSVVMLIISFTMVEKCVFCFGLQALSFLNVYLALTLDKGTDQRASFAEFFNPQKASYVVYGLIVALPIVAFMGHSRMMSKHTGKRFEAQTKAMVEGWQTSTAHPQLQNLTPILEKSSTANAGFEIVEFADFLCSHCKQAAAAFKTFLNNYKASYKLMVMPLDQTCKTLEDTTGPSCLLAKGVYCAGKQSKGWEAHDWIFERQSKLGGQPVDAIKASMSGEMASTIKLENAETFKTCLEEEGTHKAIVDSRKLAEELKITGTPSIFVNGKQLQGGQLLHVLKRAYDLSLSVDK